MSGESFGNCDVGAAVQECPLKTAAEKKTHWIEIQLVGEDDEPIPGVAYKITLPNGDETRGYLDDRGLARVENIADAGACRVTFPDLDKDAWKATPSN